MKKSFAPRNLIPVEQTWDLSPLIDSIETYNAGIAQIEKTHFYLIKNTLVILLILHLSYKY